MNCEYCGSLIFSNDRCCPKCGAPIIIKNNEYTTIGMNSNITVNGNSVNKLLYVYSHTSNIVDLGKK